MIMNFEKEVNDNYQELFYPKPMEAMSGTEPEGLPMESPAGSQTVTPAEFSMDMGNLVKGIATGAAGLTGDVLSIGRGLFEIGRRGGDESAVDAFLGGMEAGTFVPTTENINQWIDTNVPLPERMKGASTTGFIGEVVAPGGALTKVIKTSVKGGRIAGKALANEAARQVENILDKQGLILKFGPNAKVQIPVAPKIETPQFKNWFGESKVLNAESKPLLMYHGTNKGGDAGFEFFDPYASSHGLFGEGSYFTDSADIASSYTKKGRGQNPAVYPVYLSIKNPIDMDAAADPRAWLDAFPDGQDYFPKSGSNEKFYRAVEDFYIDEGYSSAEAPSAIQATLIQMGHDGITHIGGGRVAQDGVKHRVYIAFEPEQVKSVFNKGAFDPKDPKMLNSAAGGSVATGAGSDTMDKEQKAK
jgi:hypothetical protein